MSGSFIFPFPMTAVSPSFCFQSCSNRLFYFCTARGGWISPGWCQRFLAIAIPGANSLHEIEIYAVQSGIWLPMVLRQKRVLPEKEQECGEKKEEGGAAEAACGMENALGVAAAAAAAAGD